MVTEKQPALDENLIHLATRLSATFTAGCEDGTEVNPLVRFLERNGLRNHLQRNLPLWAGLNAGTPAAQVAMGRQAYAQQTANFAYSSTLFLMSILAEFEKRQIPVLAFKGACWSQMLYGNILSRPFGDIDLMVPPERQRESFVALESLGMRRGFPTVVGVGQSQALLRFAKAQSLYSPGSPHCVDLHWKLFSQWVALPLPFEDLWSRRTEIVIDGVGTVPTLGREDAILFTCLHSWQDGWANLKGLLDLAVFLEVEAPDWDLLAHLAEGRMPLIQEAVTFAVDLLGARRPRGWTATYSDPAHSFDAFKKLHQSSSLPHQGLLHPRFWSGSKARALWRSARAIMTPTVEDIMSVDIPSGLVWLYVPLRAARLIRKWGLRRRAHD